MYTRQNVSMNIYKKRSLPMHKSANMYYKPFWFCFINGFLWFNCDILRFAYFRSCLQTISLALCCCCGLCLLSFVMLCALFLLYWPLMFKTLYICICICRLLTVKPESVFQIICLYETTIFNQYGYISVILFSQSKDG